MAQPMFFVQECPTCGRGLEVRVDYLGKAVVCQHCRGEFVASDGDAREVRDVLEESVNGALERADEFLKESSTRKRPPR